MNKTVLQIIVFLGIHFPSFGQNNIEPKNLDSVIEVTKTNSNDLLGKYLYFSEDVPSHYDINDAQKLSFQRSEKNILNLGFNNKSVWNRFTIRNTSDTIIKRILRIEKPLQDSIQLFYKKNNTWIVSNTGYMVNTKDKDINGASLYFPLKFEPNSEQVYY